MSQEAAVSTALAAVTFIMAEDTLRDRFIALTGMTPDDLRANIQETEFLASTLEFLVGHEPDLLAFAENIDESPESIVHAWRTLGGGVGQEW